MDRPIFCLPYPYVSYETRFRNSSGKIYVSKSLKPSNAYYTQFIDVDILEIRAAKICTLQLVPTGDQT